MQAKYSQYEPSITPRQWQVTSDPLLIQENYSSANITPQKSPLMQTPKSILRESLNSGSKMKRNIQIDESLNETRKYSKTSHQSQAREIYYDEELVQAQIDHGYRPNTSIGGPLHGRYGSYYSQSSWSEKPSVAERFEVPPSHSYYRGDSPPNPVHDFQQGGFSEQDFTEFQKAYVRKLQREREQEISLNMNRKSDQDFEEKNNNNVQKIHELENNLREHRKRLKASIKKQTENLVVAKIEEPKIQPQPQPAVNKQVVKPVQKPGASPRLVQPQVPQNSKEEKISPRPQRETPPPSPPQHEWSSYNLQELNRISKLLREQNEDLKYEVLSMTSQMKANPNENYKDPVHVLANTILEKEQELLKVINKMKHKIQKKQQREPSQERIEKLSKKTITQKPKPIDVYTEKRNATRKLYGSKKLEVDNSNFLYQGLSTTYNDFHWYADQSLHLAKKSY